MVKIMICPMCGKYMEKGYLYSPAVNQSIFYLPNGVRLEKINILTTTEELRAKRGFFLDASPLDGDTNMHRVTAFVCRACHCGIIQYEEMK